MAYVRLLKDGISVGTVVHKAGDIVNVPDRRADAMVRYQEGVIVAQPEAKPDPPFEVATVNPKHAERAVGARQR
jgi:hypothetical protein